LKRAGAQNAASKRVFPQLIEKRIAMQKGVHADETPWKTSKNAEGNYAWMKIPDKLVSVTIIAHMIQYLKNTNYAGLIRTENCAISRTALCSPEKQN
jgi:hypothetical protein